MKKMIRLMTLIAFVIFCFSGSAVAKTYVLKLGHLSAVGGLEDLASQRIAKVAEEKSGGRLKVKIFPAAQLGNMVSMMESLAMGTQDMVWGSMQWRTPPFSARFSRSLGPAANNTSGVSTTASTCTGLRTWNSQLCFPEANRIPGSVRELPSSVHR